MILLRHLRDNMVAYLALFLVLSMGTAHAAVAIANGSITTKMLRNGAVSAQKLKARAVTTPKIKSNAITTPKLRNGAVNGSKIKDRSVGAGDLVPGVVPKDGFVHLEMVSGTAPVATPEYLAPAVQSTVTLPRAGLANLTFSSANMYANCTAGSATGALYVDGNPVPKTRLGLANSTGLRATTLAGSIPLTAGEHTLQFGIDCATGDWSSLSYPNSVWSLDLTVE